MNTRDQTDTPKLPGEEGWITDPEDCSTSQSSGTTSKEEDQPPISKERTKDKQRCIVSVQRANISSTTCQEGNEELQNLNVEIYDQQTYERGVFEQVDNVISQAEKQNDNQPNSSTSKQTSKITNLMRVVHTQGKTDINYDDDEDQAIDPSERDQLMLNLTRAQRLNKIVIKQEIIDPAYSNSTPNKSLPKIPRLSARGNTSATVRDIRVSNDINIGRSSCQSYSYGDSIVKQENLVEYSDTEGDHDSSEESSSCEYKPELDEVCTDDEDIEYQSDNHEDTDIADDRDTDDIQRGTKHNRLRDDGDLNTYRKRLKKYNREQALLRLDNILEDGTEFRKFNELVDIGDSLKIPKEMWDNLFEHQKTCVRWFWELHQLGTGGILGDEMGLGKTIQMIAFLTALKLSEIRNHHKAYKGLGPTVLVCPATVIHQWLLEFRKWYPPFRVAILHSTGTFSGDRKNLVQIINKSNGVLIVSYAGVVIYQDVLHDFDWHYAILDEGHKIRNPDAQVTLACKRFRTPHRIILSGSPVQNNLKELWSIFDFIYPGKLGTLPVFMEQFAIPITQGGYSNASDIQVQIAYKCACVLRDTIKPFLLRRTKAEVNSKLKLPDRSEQVLFCKLTEKQRKLYEAYLGSPTIRDIKSGFCQIFVGLIQLRKICNHPDLFDATECKKQIKQSKEIPNVKNLEFFSEDETYGHVNKSGKMKVVDALLKLWKKQGHKVLLFTQSRQMLKIFVNYLNKLDYKYLVMDGTTSIGNRQSIIEEFNKNDEIFVFLLTTRVGGVGVNLTGANRIIIYDPDWNPSTDIQARERAWRIGQKRHVIIYRLLTAGTIEEKIYHRQVFKLYLTNRVLKNAKHKRFFKTNDLHELFTLGDNDKDIETKALFDDELHINPDKMKKAKRKKKSKKSGLKHSSSTIRLDTAVLSEEKRLEMRERAKKLSQMIAFQYGTTGNVDSTPVRIKFEPGLETGRQTEGGETSWTPNCKVEPEVEKSKNKTLVNGHSDIPKMPSDCSKRANQKKSKKESTSKHVEYLVKQDVYKPNNRQKDKKEPRYKKDDYILERLFKNSNISGALKHDKIESDSNDDYRVVESEAEKVARDAIKALRESRAFCLDSTVGVPNWTGRNGQISKTPRLMPKNRTRMKLLNKILEPSTSSSSGSTSAQNDSLLSSIKKRNQANPIVMNRNSNGALALQPLDQPLEGDEDADLDRDFVGKSQGTGAEQMADKLREFILFKSAKNGESQTDEVLDFFKANFSADKTATFKAILYKICKFHRRGDKGFWVLKSEFRDI